jgi:hypothetical protein
VSYSATDAQRAAAASQAMQACHSGHGVTSCQAGSCKRV